MSKLLTIIGALVMWAFWLFVTVGLWVIGLGAFFQWVGIL